MRPNLLAGLRLTGAVRGTSATRSAGNGPAPPVGPTADVAGSTAPGPPPPWPARTRVASGAMGALILLMNMTADGCCDHDAVVADDALHDNASAVLDEVDAVALGATTYGLFVDHWPAVARSDDHPAAEVGFARRLDAKEKLVYSSTLGAAGVATECRLPVHPLVRGEGGVRLFDRPVGLRLTGSTPWPSGTVELRYEVSLAPDRTT
jgi:hypothetical protein